MTPRGYTKEEARTKLLDQMRSIVHYWSHQEGDVKERMEGVAFSILTMLDGSTSGIPSIDLVLRPHESDAEYHRANGDNWWADGMVINDDCMLHDQWYRPRAS